MTTFRGFDPKALPFFKALAFHQSKEWFEANRMTYETEVKGPMGDLVEAVAPRLAKAGIPVTGDRKSSLFRIHRDVRFSKNKDPYKTNAGIALTRGGSKSEPGMIYFHLSPEGCFFAAGFYHPEPEQLARLRGAAARSPKAYKQMIGKIGKVGLALSEEEALKRVPRGFDDVADPDIAAALRQKNFICVEAVAKARIAAPALVDDLVAFAKKAAPLLSWGWDALVVSR